MNSVQIERNLQSLIESFNKETFIFDLLLAYGTPKASISRLQNGNLNLSKVEGEIDWKKKLFFKTTFLESPQELFKAVIENPRVFKHEPRFVIVTDSITLIAKDTKTLDTIEITINELPKYFDFFLPWAGMEKKNHVNENPDDVKAADKMAKLFDEIRKDNPDPSPEFAHSLNVFLSRLLFCFFAEDTNIFAQGQFTNGIDSHTQSDGSDLHSYFDKLFEVLDTPEDKRIGLPVYLQAFPYVNGGLFRQHFASPKFTRRSRLTLVQVGDLQWKEINPDIFGSMFQAVISVDQRGNLGQHYTSVPNIMKVIEPLFLNDLYDAFEKAKNDPRALQKLLIRLSKIKIFDPACGSGNFLIIAYKELRRLEIKIIQHLIYLQKLAAGFNKNTEQLEMFSIPQKQLALAASFQVELFSHIQLSNFFGIEIDDFAHEIAQLSLWLAEHQMNVEFFNEFGRTNPTLPLRESGNIVQGNACRLDWDDVCPKQEGDEVYVLGNPPYLGAKLQEVQQRSDLSHVFKNIKDFKNLDYISCWFYKASFYIKDSNNEAAFVSTKSVIQGNQVGLLWPNLYNNKIEIGFAYPPFKWTNNAKDKAGVQVVIFSIRGNLRKKRKYIFGEYCKEVDNIGPYLNEGPSIIVSSRRSSISKLPEMVFGNMPLEGNFLKLSQEERDEILAEYPLAKKFIRPLIGGEEFLNSIPRFCLWIEDDNLAQAVEISPINERIEQVREFRANGGEVAQTLVNRAHQFRYRRVSDNGFILIPRTTSERRTFMQCGFFSKDVIPIESAQVIYDSEPFIFSILSSSIHMIWVKAVGGYLGTSIRYSTEICYNSFPFPLINETQKQELTQCTFRILEEREKHPEKTLAELYDPDKMPEGMREAHRLNDLAIERCYRSKPFESDEERLEYLFKLYEQMIDEEQNGGTLFSAENKPKSKTKKK